MIRVRDIPGHEVTHVQGEDYGRCDDPFCRGGHAGADTWTCTTCGWHGSAVDAPWRTLTEDQVIGLQLSFDHLAHAMTQP